MPMVCLKSQEHMGSTPRTVGDGDTDSVSPEELLERTRSPRKPLVFIPRSRSPSDLPGGIRVPVLRKPESRLRARLEENLAGLKELEALREKHQTMVQGATRTEHMHHDHMQKTSYSSSQPAVHYGGLSSITEEVRSIRTDRVPIHSDQSVECFSNAEQSDDEYLDTDHSQSSTPERNSPKPPDLNNTKFQHGFKHLNAPLDASESFPSPRYYSSRRASVQCTPHKMTVPVGLSKESQIRPQLRRASFQCETIMTKPIDRETPSKVISDIKLHCSNDTSPLHAITRQYASSSNLKSSESNLAVIDTPVSTKDPKMVLQDWLKESQNFSISNSHQNKMSEKHLIDSAEHLSPKEHNNRNNSETPSSRYGFCGNIREQSFTSDYYGSVETINSVQSLPARVTNPRMRHNVSDVTDSRLSGSSKYSSHRRRHSLPTNALLRQRLSNSASNTNNSSQNSQILKNSKVHKHRNSLCPDDDVFGDSETSVNLKSTPKQSRPKSSTGNLTADEGYEEDVASDFALKHNEVIKTNNENYNNVRETKVLKPNKHEIVIDKQTDTEVPKHRKPLLETAL